MRPRGGNPYETVVEGEREQPRGHQAHAAAPAAHERARHVRRSDPRDPDAARHAARAVRARPVARARQQPRRHRHLRRRPRGAVAVPLPRRARRSSTPRCSSRSISIRAASRRGSAAITAASSRSSRGRRRATASTARRRSICIDCGGYVRAPITKDLSIAVAGRRSYIDFILPLFLPEPEPGAQRIVTPVYYDYQARLDYNLHDDGRLSAVRDRLVGHAARAPAGRRQRRCRRTSTAR